MANNSDKKTYDVVVIGGGPGGYVAAIRASQLGLKTAIVERENLGGVCLNWGCIPTKALLRAAEIYHLAETADRYGITMEKLSFDLAGVVKRSRDVAATLSGGISHLMKKNKIDVFMANASLETKTGSHWRVALTHADKSTDLLSANKIVLANGARARQLPAITPDGDKIVTYRDAMTPKTMPKSLIIIGSGAIGIEFASFYADMGVSVTVVEAADRIMPVEDAEISAMAEKLFTDRGIIIHKHAMLDQAKASGDGVNASITINGKSQTLKADRMILAIGIVANVEDLGLEQAGIKLEKGHVVTNGHGETSVEGIYAIGDMTGAPWLAHKASHEGIIAAEHIAGISDNHAINPLDVPGCTYCRPQVASVGYTEQAARDAGYQISVGRFPFRGNGKAIALGDDNGMIKTIFDEKTGELLGAHMIGPEVTELIQGYVIARQCEATEAELMQAIFPHPTLSEAMHESVLDAFDKVIHF
ncbi:MAG: dihydrolipoyl dehydrogenase [Candidatus Puniceispirillales bacterium]